VPWVILAKGHWMRSGCAHGVGCPSEGADPCERDSNCVSSPSARSTGPAPDSPLGCLRGPTREFKLAGGR
jgi:hypothetical protein